MDRKADLARIRRALSRALPLAAITTNDDANLATPMAVIAKWDGGRITKVIRAQSIGTPVEEFVKTATTLLTAYQAGIVRPAD